MNSGLLLQMWNNAAAWQIWTAPVLGVIVGWIYFYSLRWSVNYLEKTAHKLRMFAITALLRILLFFTVMVLVGQRNVAVILIYIVAFFLTRMVIIWREKAGYIVENQNEEKGDGL